MKKKSYRRCLAPLLFALVTVPSVDVVAAETAERRVDAFEFKIPAQKLADSLVAISELTGLQLIASSDLTRGRLGAEVAGRLSVEQALQRLLQGSGLIFRFIDNRTISIEASNSGQRVLGPVRVEGASNVADFSKSLAGVNGSTDPTATEGSGSYVAPGASTGSIGPESLREIPRSITVLTQEQLIDQNIVTMEDALRRTPGVTFVPKVGDQVGAEIYIRGRPVESIQVDGGAPAASYRGGVFGAFDLSQYDHIEILKGPEALSVGSGSLSGTINLVRKQPLSTPQTILELSAGQFDAYRGMLDVTGPIAGGVKGRLVTTLDDRNSFSRGVQTRRESVYGVLEYNPFSSTALRVGFGDSNQQGVTWRGGIPRYSNGEQLPVSRRFSFVTPWSHEQIEKSEIFASVDQTLTTPSLLSSTWLLRGRYTESDGESESRHPAVQGAANRVTGAGVNIARTRYGHAIETKAVELSLIGSAKLFDHGIDLDLRLNRSKNDAGARKLYRANAATAIPNVLAFDPATVPEPASNVYLSHNLLALTEDYQGYAYRFRIESWKGAHLSAGGNGGSAETFSDQIEYSNPAVTPVPPPERRTRTNKNDNMGSQPTFGFTQELGWGLLGYASYAGGRIANVNYRGMNEEFLPPLNGRQAEVGVRFTDEANRLSATLALHQSKYKGQYLGTDVWSPKPDGSTCCWEMNEDRVEINNGVELEVAGRLGRQWQIVGGYSFNDQNVKDPTPEANRNNFVTQQPAHHATLWIEYEPSWLPALGVSIGSTFRSTTYVNGRSPTSYDLVTGLPIGPFIPFEYEQKAYQIVDLAISYELTDKIELALNVNNLLDEFYYERINNTSGGNLFGSPRAATFRVLASW